MKKIIMTNKAKFKKAYNELMHEDYYSFSSDKDTIVKVNWKDARTLSGTSGLQDIKNNGLLNAVTIGYLIHETEDYLAIASFLFPDEHHNINDPITTTAFRDVHYIPKKLVKSILALKIDFDNSKKYREAGGRVS